MADGSEGLAEVERRGCSLDLIPGIADVDGGGGDVGDHVTPGFSVVAVGVFITFLGVNDGKDQCDQGGDRDEKYSDEDEGENAHWEVRVNLPGAL